MDNGKKREFGLFIWFIFYFDYTPILYLTINKLIKHGKIKPNPINIRSEIPLPLPAAHIEWEINANKITKGIHITQHRQPA